MWQPYRPPSSRKKPNVPPTRQTQARKNRRVDTIVISDDESDSAPAPHDSPSPAGIHAPPLLTDGILLKDKSSRQNPSSCERSSSSVGREKAKGQVESSTPVPHFINSAAERKRKESLDTIIVAKPNLSTKRRRIDLHHKPSPSRDNAQQDHTQGTEKTSGGAQVSCTI
jgi:hypothetical protein